MVDIKGIKRPTTPFPLKTLIQRKSSTNYHSIDSPVVETLGSNTIVSNSIIKRHEIDPYMPNMIARKEQQHKRRSTNSIITTDLNKQIHVHHHHHHYYSRPFYNNQHHHSTSNLPPLSPPPLSPTSPSFANSSRPSWRELKRSATYQPASSISSSSDEDDDDEPLGLFLKESLLNDQSDEDDDDLVPIAKLSISRENSHHLSAAEKYKAKVRARLDM